MPVKRVKREATAEEAHGVGRQGLGAATVGQGCIRKVWKSEKEREMEGEDYRCEGMRARPELQTQACKCETG